MKRFSPLLSRVALLALFGALTVLPSLGQTGPGGVGDSTKTVGSDKLTVWLRSNVGVTVVDGSESVHDSKEVDLWKDASGQNHHFEDDADAYDSKKKLRQPQYKPDALNGHPVLRFNTSNETAKDILTNSDPGVMEIPDGDYTFFVVAAAREKLSGRNSFWYQFLFTNSNGNTNMGYPGDSEGIINVDKNGTGPTFDLASAVTDYRVFSNVADNTTDGEEDLGVDGIVRDTTESSSVTASGHLEIGRKGTLAKENFAEVIMFKEDLNTAQRRLVANYLAEKYDLSLDGHDYYRFGTVFPYEVVGIGRATSAAGASSGGKHTTATSSILTFEENTSRHALNDGEFVMAGHDGNPVQFTTNERPNGKSTVQRTRREWRVEVTGSTQKTVDMTVDFGGLPLPNGYNDRALYVVKDGDFSNDAAYYDLDNSSGSIYSVNGVTLSDGDYVTVAAVKRTVNFTVTEKSVQEDIDGSPDMQMTATLNFPHDSDITVNLTDSGDLDGDGDIEDGGVTNVSGDGPDGGNGNGNFEADDGSGNDNTTGSSCGDCDNDPDGPKAGDYALAFTQKTIQAGDTSATFGVNIDNDDIAQSEPYEQTETFEVEFGTIDGQATPGPDDRFRGKIMDDDNPKFIAYSDPNDSDGRTKTDASYNPTSQPEGAATLTYEVALPDTYTGNGGDMPTEATYKVTSGGATAGEDFKLVDGKDGTRVSATEGTVTIPSDSQYGQFEIEVLSDEMYEADEALTLELTEAQGGTPDGDDKTSITLTIQEDDPKPTVTFTSKLFTSQEDTDAGLNVSLSAAAQVDIDVTFEDEGTGTASDTDYTFPADPTLTIPAGDATGTFLISLNDNDTKEENETIDVGITGASNATVGSPSSSTHKIIDDDVLGSVGPGGVGNAQTIAVWTEVENTNASDGDPASILPDSSGNGIDATGVRSEDYSNDLTSNPATYVESDPDANGQVVAEFTDADHFYNAESPVVRSLPDADHTLFGVSKLNPDGGDPDGLFETKTSDGNYRRSFGYSNDKEFRVSQYDADAGSMVNLTFNPSGTGTLDNDFHLLSSEVEGGSLDLWHNGEQKDEKTGLSPTGMGTAPIIGYNRGTQRKFYGKLGELIAYDASLNRAQRLIVYNYLSAKYDVGLDANDLYAGDESSNGNFDYGVMGVGRDGGPALEHLHSRARRKGIALSAKTVGEGEYVMIGTEARVPSTPVSRLNRSGTDGVSGLTARPDSVHFVSVTGSPSFSVAFTLTSLGFESRFRKPDGYVLLYASAGSCTPDQNDCSWSSASATTTVNDDRVTFADVSLGAGDYYVTIGTTKPRVSPLLNNYAVTVRGERGTDGTDAGWRYIGAPVQGALIDDLQPSVAASGRDGLVRFGDRQAWHWSLYNGDSQKNAEGWTEFEQGWSIPNGRGFIVHFRDDSSEPIDPETWIDVEPKSGPPGNTNVTVGDDSPAADTKLHPDSTLHLLANPYTTDYDLSDLNLTVDGDGDGTIDFKQGVEMWDPQLGSYTTVMRNDSDAELAPWEAFFVERNDDQGSVATQLTFDAAGRQPTNDESFIGSKTQAASSSHRRIDLRLRARNESGAVVARDHAAGLYFHPQAGAGADAFDISKLDPASQDYAMLGLSGPDMTESSGLYAMLSRRFTPQSGFEVPIQLQTTLSSGRFEVSAPDWTNIPAAWSVTLIDTKGTADPKDDEKHAFSPEDSTAYSFTLASSKASSDSTSQAAAGSASSSREAVPSLLTTSAGPKAKGGDDSARFRLKVTPGSALPVDLASLNASVDETDVLLKWRTVSETNNAGFQVEHQRLPADTSAGPRSGQWSTVGFVEGAGTTKNPQTYRKRMDNLEYGRHAFRLRQVDTDGKEAYSDVLEADVRLTDAHDVEPPYPNPTRQRASLDVTVRKSQPVTVRLYDVLGRRVRTVLDETMSAQRTRTLRVRTADLSSGVYFIRVRGDDFSTTHRMTVVR